jgi:hypothetical protein
MPIFVLPTKEIAHGKDPDFHTPPPAEATTVEASRRGSTRLRRFPCIVAACFDRLALRQRARMLGRCSLRSARSRWPWSAEAPSRSTRSSPDCPKVPVSLEDAALATSRQVQEIVRYIEQSNPQLFNNLLGLLARDTTTIAALGASIAALTMHTLANRREPRPGRHPKPQVSAD